MPEELDLPEATPPPLPDPLSIKPETLSIEPETLSVEPDVVAAEPDPIGRAEDDEPISLVEEFSDEGEAGGVSRVRQRERGSNLLKEEVTLKRPLNLTGTGATRCRLFHCRIAVEAIENMEMRINQWIDNDHIEIKHVCQELAVMEGKNPKPNLVISVWY